MMNWLKHWLKKHFLMLKIRNRFNPDVQLIQRQLFHTYRQMAADQRPIPLSETGFRVFSQFEEDGKLLYIFSLLGMEYKTFIEIGADDGINSNAANLCFNFGWHGLFIDGNPKAIERGRRFYSKYPHGWMYQPTFVCARVKRENINQLIENAGYTGKVGLLSIDIDGNDYWIWDAIVVAEPVVVIIETHVVFGLHNIVVPYNPEYSYPGEHPQYHGASPVAMVKLAASKGYRLVGANELGFNFIFVKNGYGDDLLPEVPVESVLKHPSVIDGFKKFEAVRNMPYQTPFPD